MNDSLGIVVIGRNEGERLRLSLESAATAGARIVYVDSGSTDGSLELAQSFGASVLELDLTMPFTAGRARNAGFAALSESSPPCEFVQFLDGDCQLSAGWLAAGLSAIRTQADIAIVMGRVHEKHPEASVYNLLCDMEWNMPVGEVTDCGGIFLARASAFQKVGGFRDEIISGEDSELCFRLHRRGFRIVRVDQEMTRHDADIRRFGQWWRRAVRSGHAYAEALALHFKDGERFRLRQVISIMFYAAAIPVATLLAAMAFGPVCLLILMIYAIQIWRIRRFRMNQRHDPASAATIYGFFSMIGKFAELVGIGLYWLRRLGRKRRNIIEYK